VRGQLHAPVAFTYFGESGYEAGWPRFWVCCRMIFVFLHKFLANIQSNGHHNLIQSLVSVLSTCRHVKCRCMREGAKPMYLVGASMLHGESGVSHLEKWFLVGPSGFLQLWLCILLSFGTQRLYFGTRLVTFRGKYCLHLQEKHYVSATDSNLLILFRETVAVYCENHTEHTDTVCTLQETHYVSAQRPTG
jgi:hypothetical protein